MANLGEINGFASFILPKGERKGKKICGYQNRYFLNNSFYMRMMLRFPVYFMCSEVKSFTGKNKHITEFIKSRLF